MITNIIVNLQYAATHYWDTCPENHSQAYLKYPHRHVFHITMKCRVDHNDRDIEIIEFKNKILNYLEKGYPNHNFGPQSCEMICHDLMDFERVVYVQVLEDNENGAEVYVTDNQ